MTTTRVLRGKAQFGSHLEPATIVISADRVDAISRDQESSGNFAYPVQIDDVDIISAGLIDLQVNGGNGHEVGNDPAALDAVSAWLPETGVTSWLPTVVSASADFYPGAFDGWDRINPIAGASPLGYHLEGPFLSPQKKGAHQVRYIEEANQKLFESWLEQSSIRLVTLAPERDDAIRRIETLSSHGIVVSLGHTNATYEQFRSGIDAGATKATHLFNTMPTIHHRDPGAMVATLNDDRITAGLIPDGVHTHPGMIDLAVRAKGIDGIVIVSDMMSAAGLQPGSYGLGGQKVTVDDVSARLGDGTLAGSMLTMEQAVRNLVDWSVVSLGEALHMCTAVPARVIRESNRGALRAGAFADLTIWSADLHVAETIVGGTTVWRR